MSPLIYYVYTVVWHVCRCVGDTSAQMTYWNLRNVWLTRSLTILLVHLCGVYLHVHPRHVHARHAYLNMVHASHAYLSMVPIPLTHTSMARRVRVQFTLPPTTPSLSGLIGSLDQHSCHLHWDSQEGGCSGLPFPLPLHRYTV